MIQVVTVDGVEFTLGDYRHCCVCHTPLTNSEPFNSDGGPPHFWTLVIQHRITRCCMECEKTHELTKHRMMMG